MWIASRGAAVGVAAGFLARGAVAWYYVGDGLPWLALPSAGIGALVGGIAGATGRPLRGAAVGAVLSGVVFGLFLVALASVFGVFGTALVAPDLGAQFLAHGLPYALQMGLAGALAGLAGGAAGPRPPAKPAPPDHDLD